MKIELSKLEENRLFKELLSDPGVLEYFPMYDQREIDDSVKIWEIFCKKGASLTAYVDGQACGLAYLNIQPYKKFEHQCLITIIVHRDFRGKGIGTDLVQGLFKLAKETFGIEILHLEVYETNPAINLYKRLGFTQFGHHKKFIKEKDRYIGKIFMQRSLTQ